MENLKLLNIDEILELSCVLPPPLQLFFLRNLKRSIDVVKERIDKNAR